MQLAAWDVGAAGAFVVVVVWDGRATAAVVGTLRADGDGLGAEDVLGGAATTGGVLVEGAAVVGAALDVVDVVAGAGARAGADVLVLCETFARAGAPADPEAVD
ncbi:hypothetical protein [Catenulispora acidiphila]|nr:hypothetical protein [Catenulispora acidiphila]